MVVEHKIEVELYVYLDDYYDKLFQIGQDQEDHMHISRYLFHSITNKTILYLIKIIDEESIKYFSTQNQ
jgi:hypothetical protein